MYVTENGTYIEEADKHRIENYDDFLRFVDEHGAVVLLSKDVVRDLYEFLELLGEGLTTGESK